MKSLFLKVFTLVIVLILVLINKDIVTHLILDSITQPLYMAGSAPDLDFDLLEIDEIRERQFVERMEERLRNIAQEIEEIANRERERIRVIEEKMEASGVPNDPDRDSRSEPPVEMDYNETVRSVNIYQFVNFSLFFISVIISKFK